MVALLDIYHSKIPAIRTAITYAEWRADFKKVSELKIKEQGIRKKINGYITFYKTQMDDKYLEKRLYEHHLCELENYFEKEFNHYHCDWYHFK